jgi:hypothetical protein
MAFKKILLEGDSVTSISKSGSAELIGDVTLSEGANITLTQAGQNIAITAAGGGSGISESLAIAYAVAL